MKSLVNDLKVFPLLFGISPFTLLLILKLFVHLCYKPVIVEVDHILFQVLLRQSLASGLLVFYLVFNTYLSLHLTNLGLFTYCCCKNVTC
jgi:hypothetical protein